MNIVIYGQKSLVSGYFHKSGIFHKSGYCNQDIFINLSIFRYKINHDFNSSLPEEKSN